VGGVEGARQAPLPDLDNNRAERFIKNPVVGRKNHDGSGALGFSLSAWRYMARDAHIGWDDATRVALFHLVAGNASSPIPADASRSTDPRLHVLSRATWRISPDSRRAYGYFPVLLETFAERE